MKGKDFADAWNEANSLNGLIDRMRAAIALAANPHWYEWHADVRAALAVRDVVREARRLGLLDERKSAKGCLMKRKTVFVATDGSEWDLESEALRRDALDAEVRAIEATLPKPPDDSSKRVAVEPDVFKAAKVAVVELCRREFPRESVFQHDPMEIHPMSFAGRLLDEVGGPLRRVWFRFACYRDGWMYEQPFYALNPHEFQAR